MDRIHRFVACARCAISLGVSALFDAAPITPSTYADEDSLWRRFTICGIIDLRSVIWTRVSIWPQTGPVILAQISPKPLQRVPIGLLPGDSIRNRATVGE